MKGGDRFAAERSFFIIHSQTSTLNDSLLRPEDTHTIWSQDISLSSPKRKSDAFTIITLPFIVMSTWNLVPCGD